jgi:large subunit ribosomal protein L7/L12
MRSSQPQSQTQSQRDQSTEFHYTPLTSATEELLQVPQPEGEVRKFSPKIESLVNEITKLNLIEVGELSDLLKKKLNLPDVPVMPVGGFSPVAAAAAPEVIESRQCFQFNPFHLTHKISDLKALVLLV